MRIKSNKSGSRPGIWVLLTLFFCVFSFSGFVPTVDKPLASDLTEELNKPPQNDNHKLVTYKTAFVKYYHATNSFIANSSFHYYLKYYNESIALRLNELKQQRFEFHSFLPFNSPSEMQRGDTEKSDELS